MISGGVPFGAGSPSKEAGRVFMLNAARCQLKNLIGAEIIFI
jgi:hypothetical protein